MDELRWKRNIELMEGEKVDLIYDWDDGNVVSVPKGSVVKLKESLEQQKYEEEIKDTVSELFARGLIKKKKDENIENKQDADIGALYFMPSMKCNFRCSYCFVGEEVNHNNSKIMADDIVRATVEFVKKEVSRLKLAYIRVLLFGGEPTLCIDKHIKFMDLMNEMQEVKIGFALITNGYFLPKEEIRYMKDNGLENIQVTIDGPRLIHDKRRMLRGGEGTYDTIIENIDWLCKENIKIAIRINIDNENYRDLYPLIEVFYKKGLNRNVLMQFVPVDPSSFSDRSGYKENVLSEYEGLYSFAFERGFEVAVWNRGCSVKDKFFFAVDPLGDLYKCSSFVGMNEYKIGNVLTGYNSKYYDYINMEYDEECSNCKYFNFCRGGCKAVKLLEGSEEAFCIKKALQKINLAYVKAKYDRNYFDFRKKGIAKEYDRKN